MKKLKSAAFFGMLFAMIFTCIVAYASSYSSTLAFQGEYQGATRSFDGQNIRYTADTYSSNPNYINKVYYVSLYRKNFIGSTLIGKSTDLDRDGYSKVDWSNVGKGKYYLYFTKARDGYNVYSNNVKIYNY